ncbi:hypothetical protein WA158_005282 [Blastocystis sp. Blastoise]
MLRTLSLRPLTKFTRSIYVEPLRGTIGLGGQHSEVPMKVCVFGASTGNLGRNVVNELGKRGAIVNIPCRGDIDEALRMKPCGEVGKINGVPFHPKDEQSIADAIGNCDVVVNCVGKYYQTKFLLPWMINYTYIYNYFLKELFLLYIYIFFFIKINVNVFWPERLAKVCKSMGVKNLLHVSALQGNVNHASEWARSKAMGEKVLREAYPDATIVRPADMFGMEDRCLTWIAVMARKYPYLLTIFNGEAFKQPVAYNDVAKVITKWCSTPEDYYGKTIELAGPKIYTQKEVYIYNELNLYFYYTIHYHPHLFNTPVLVAKAITFLMECGPIPYMTRSELISVLLIVYLLKKIMDSNSKILVLLP